MPTSLDVALRLLFATTVPIFTVVWIQLIRMVVQIILCLHRAHLLSDSKLLCTRYLRNDRHCCQPQKSFDFVLFHSFCITRFTRNRMLKP